MRQAFLYFKVSRQESLAEFAPVGAKRIQVVFSRDMCVAENTSQAASVGSARSSGQILRAADCILLKKVALPLF